MSAERATLLQALESAGGVEARWMLRDYQEELANPESQSFFLESHDGTLQGFVFYRVVDNEAWILQLAVGKKGQGLGTELMNRFLTSIQKRGLTSAGLEVSDKNEAALRLYAKFRFEKIGHRKAYYRNGDAAWVLRRTIK